MGFSKIFQDISGRLLLKLSRKEFLSGFVSTEAAVRRTCNKKLRIKCLLNKIELL